MDTRGARLVGAIPEADVAAMMAAARVLVYPSRLEGFGLPVLEAMAQRTPVVVTAGTAPAEIAGAGGIGVDTRTPTVLADAVASVFDDDALRDRLASAAEIRAGQFSWPTCANDTLAVYERVIR